MTSAPGESVIEAGGPGPFGRRQFVLSRSPITTPEGYLHREVASGHLYTCPTLPLTVTTGPEGHDRVLLGIAHDTDTGLEPDLAQIPSDLLETAYRSWTGRWVLIADGEVHLDATGMLSVFYGPSGIASIPTLLPGVTAAEQHLRPELILPFHPGPTTPFDQVCRLLPSERLVLDGHQVRPRALPGGHDEGHAAPELLERLGDILLSTVAAADRVGPLVVPATAGYDSRLIVAACVKLGLTPRLATQIAPTTSTADREVPREMARRLGLQHDMVRRRRRVAEHGRRYDEQVAGLVHEADRDFMVHEQFGWLGEGDVVLRGILFDGTRSGLHARTDGLPMDDAGAWAVAFGADSAQQEGLREWLRTVQDNPQPISVHDRFWFDQKTASYAAMSETALDLRAAHSLLPGNCWTYQTAALSLPESWRMASRHHTELIGRWAPQIAGLPYNPPRRGIDKARRVKGALIRRGRSASARLQQLRGTDGRAV